MGEGSVRPERPGVVEALGGLKITKVACGAGCGWLCAAVSQDGAGYVWGRTMGVTGGGGGGGGSSVGEKEGEIRCLKDAGAGEVVLVELPSQLDDDDVEEEEAASAEPEDVVDVGVGANHIAVVTASGKLFVVGDNKNGQLGLGKDMLFVSDWTPVPGLSKVRSVFCAPKATFVVVAT